MHASPIDYLMAMSGSAAGLPVVGRCLKPLGAIAAMSVWGYRQAPNVVSSLISAATKTRLDPDAAEVRRQDLHRTPEVSTSALRDIVCPERLQIDWPTPDRMAPVLRHARRPRQLLHRTSVRYGDAPEQVLDVWRRRELPAQPAPVLVFVPGGGWVHGGRTLQGYALLSHLAALGWVCLSIDYRVSPHHRWPRHVSDVKAAVAWARANVDRFGGDRDFVTIAGCSAGGHLAALTGLTADDSEFHGELPPDANTSVNAVVSMYGRYDWEDRSTPERARFMDFLQHIVVGKRYEHHPDVFRAASPIFRVRTDAPPFLVVHGSADIVIPVEQARAFVERMRSTSREWVGYLELPGAHHAFDLIDGARTPSAVTAIGLFLNEVHRSNQLSRARNVV